MSVVYVRFRVGPDHGAGPDAAPRVLGRLLARADGSTAIEDWREDAVRFVTNGRICAPAVGPVAWWAAGHEPRRDLQSGLAAAPLANDFAAHICVATPLHCVAGMSSVGLPPAGILRLATDEARDLAADFNRRFDGAGQRLFATPADGLLCAFERPLLARTFDPERVLGQSIGPYLPTGRDGAVLRSLMSEIEMWLFDHPVNRRRAAAQRPPVTGLWLWGGGGVLRELPSLDAWVAGEDLLLSAWPRQTEWPDSRARLGGELPRSGLVVITHCPDDAVWSTWEATWLAPAEAGLRAGHIARIAVSAGEHRYDLSTRASRRFWRRARPWRDYFA